MGQITSRRNTRQASPVRDQVSSVRFESQYPDDDWSIKAIRNPSNESLSRCDRIDKEVAVECTNRTLPAETIQQTSTIVEKACRPDVDVYEPSHIAESIDDCRASGSNTIKRNGSNRSFDGSSNSRSDSSRLGNSPLEVAQERAESLNEETILSDNEDSGNTARNPKNLHPGIQRPKNKVFAIAIPSILKRNTHTSPPIQPRTDSRSHQTDCPSVQFDDIELTNFAPQDRLPSRVVHTSTINTSIVTTQPPRIPPMSIPTTTTPLRTYVVIRIHSYNTVASSSNSTPPPYQAIPRTSSSPVQSCSNSSSSSDRNSVGGSSNQRDNSSPDPMSSLSSSDENEGSDEGCYVKLGCNGRCVTYNYGCVYVREGRCCEGCGGARCCGWEHGLGRLVGGCV